MPEAAPDSLRLSPHVIAAREELTENLSRWADLVWTADPWTIAAEIVQIRRKFVVDAIQHAAQEDGWPLDRLATHLAVVAHGGFGRGDLAAYSDTDLLFLLRGSFRKKLATTIAAILRELVDIGLNVGHYALTPRQLIGLAGKDPVVFTSLCEAKFLWGNNALFAQTKAALRLWTAVCRSRLYHGILRARQEERERYGETVYLNEPSVKRSEGALRDLHMIRWLSALQSGNPNFASLVARGILRSEDVSLLEDAWSFLLRVRQAMHLHLGRPTDLLTRAEQVYLAEKFGFRRREGLLPAELFMREYFRHTYTISRCVHVAAEATAPYARAKRALQILLGKKLGPDWVVSQGRILPTTRGQRRLKQSLEAVLEFVHAAMECNAETDALVWELIRSAHSQQVSPPTPRAKSLFWAILDRPVRLGEVLSRLHEAGILEQFVPGLNRAKGLLQFNQYHKYTVDRHCLRAVDWAASLRMEPGLLGEVYRQLPRKAVLHLALLMHDLGKGFEEDHSQVARRLAEEAASFLSLPAEDAEDLVFLVERHLLMNHLAFRRDSGDEHLVVQFAVEVGSVERLSMLFILTAADLAAVGPGGWNSWKADVLAELYQRAHRHLTGEVASAPPESYVRQQLEAVQKWLGPSAESPFFASQLAHLPATYLSATPAWRVAEDLRLLARLRRNEVHVEVTWHPQRETVSILLATNEAIGPGIFHKLVGAISSEGFEILAADIHTLHDGWVIDRVEARDPDYPGQPPAERLTNLADKIRQSVRIPGPVDFRFRQSWFMRPASRPTVAAAKTRVQTSNRISPNFTVIDVFAVDRPGLLFTLAKTLFEMGLSVARARIGTYLDQVVDVFYVTDQNGLPITDDAKLEEIRNRLLTAAEALPK
ncbi:MAG: HD domain-containing protein [Thermoguttaceae bacterium]|nr:HD domain-containing protein [Thermoguttaceae bacterium]